MRPLNALVMGMCFLDAVGCGSKGPPESTRVEKVQMQTQEETALSALSALKQLVTADNAKTIGLQSVDEARDAALGKPIARKVIGYNNLVDAKADTPIAQLFTSEEVVIYPVVVKDAMRSSVSIAKAGERWQIASVADGYWGALLSATPELASRQDVQLISIPGLNLEFFGLTGTEEVAAAQDYPELEFKRGQPVDSKRFVQVTVAYAKEFDKQHGEEIRKRRVVR